MLMKVGGSNMITLSKVAENKITEIAEKEVLKPIVRAGIKGGGCAGYKFDLYFEDEKDIKETDQVFDFNHDVKIVIDMMSMVYLEGTNIDYVDNLTGAGFKFNNSSAKTTCGCGQSFKV